MSTAPTSSPRRWPVVLAVAAAVAAIAVLVWFLLGTGQRDVAAPTADVSSTPSASAEPSPAPSPELSETEPAASPTESSGEASEAAPSEQASVGSATTTDVSQDVVLWFTGEHADTTQNPMLYPEPTEVSAAAGTEPAQAAVDALLSSLPADPEYTNAFWDDDSESSDREPATATVYSSDAGTTIDLSEDAFAIGIGSAYAELGVQQIVHTALANGAFAPVMLTVDGQSGAEVWGVLALEATYELDESVWTSASIVSIRDGETLSSPVTLSGVGFGFEGELDVLALAETSGEVIEQTFVMLAEGAGLTEQGEPIRSDYSIDLDLEPGTYRLVVADADQSGDSGWISYDDKVVTVE